MLHNPRPGGMREAIKSAAPEGEHGVMKLCLRFLRLLTKSKPGPAHSADPPSTCQHLPAFASIASELFRRFLCDVNEESAPLRFWPTSRPSKNVRRQRRFGTSRVNVHSWPTSRPDKSVRRQRTKPTFSHDACSCWLLAALLATRWPPRSATRASHGPRCTA